MIKAALTWLLKSTPSMLLALGITSLVVVGIPEKWRIYLGYNEILEEYRPYISMAGVISFSFGFIQIIIATAIIPIKDYVARKIMDWQYMRKGPGILKKLTTQEKKCLADYVQYDLSTKGFNISDGVINGLEYKNVVYRAADMSGRYQLFAYNLQPWVTETLSKHPDLKEEILQYFTQIL